MEVVNAKCPDHLILGEEGGISGDISSPFLWCIDPLGNYMIVIFTNRAFIMTIVLLYVFQETQSARTNVHYIGKSSVNESYKLAK